MKGNQTETFISKLTRIQQEVGVLTRPDSKDDFRKNLDELITTLDRLRGGLADPSLAEKATEIQRPLEQLLDFLEFAKSNEVLAALLLPTRKFKTPKPKRQPVEIPSDLTNEQIRALLERDLSKAELRTIAVQRAISVGKSNNEELKQRIVRNLERQEGYGRLAKP
jgi:hypothetical protein